MPNNLYYNEFKQRILFETILAELKTKGGNKSGYGTLFEHFCKKVLLVSPFFADDIANVWNWNEFPGNGGLHDNGIDLVALTKSGDFWAIQCKFYDRDSQVTKAGVDSFLAASLRSFVFNGKTYNFSERFVFSTTDNVSQNSSGLYVLFGPENLFQCGIDWEHFSLEELDNMQALDKKSPKEHQSIAIEKVLNGFKSNNRGRLIMACGTGKTFTSLKIVEGYVDSLEGDKTRNVLYLVPSIPLLSQTIMEWKTQLSIQGQCNMFGICSDETAGQDKRSKQRDEILVQMPIPATTDAQRIKEELSSNNFVRINFFFSTYQSIDVVKNVQDECGIVFDIVVCDEAHRTIGAYKESDEDISCFVKIHDEKFIKADKRLYMTATEKIYSSNAKTDAEEGGWKVYSMDDEKIYGPEFYYLSFGDAVTKQLLTDYRLLVLNIRKSDVANLRLPESSFANLDDASRIIGALTALSKIPPEGNPDEFVQDPNPMKRVVAFCSTIAQADAIAQSFNHLADKKCLGEEYMIDQGFVLPKAKLITGQDNTKEKNKKLNWLRDEIKDGECRILTNARCLSEGVDVPSLDSVVFMAKKRSQVDIIQAVGRVMRKFGSGTEKKYGYIVIPVVISDEKLTDKTLSASEDYKVVWQVVQALRSHDERLDTEINKVGVTGNLPASICVLNTFIPPISRKGKIAGSLKRERDEGFDTDDVIASTADYVVRIPTDEELKENEKVFSAQLVKHCGNRLYWEDWSKNIGDVTNNIALKIKTQIDDSEKAKREFEKFKSGIIKLINPSISDQDCINMLAEHMVTLPVLKALFNNNDLIEQNSITRIMQNMISKLSNLEKETDELEPFYESVRRTVEGVQTSEGRQEIIRKLFEKFFQYALPSSAEKFGIVYTPIEIVDFIVNSVADAMKQYFSETLSDKGVKIIDPFTGTGTFVVRLIDKIYSQANNKEELRYKFENDVWCNEIMLLAYYIALINIEDTFSKLYGEMVSFKHAVLTDTFETSEKKKSISVFPDADFERAKKIVEEEEKQDIRIVIANPPYSVGQRSANDNNANDMYESIDARIKETYAKDVSANNLNSLYDSYVKSFRWASDRLNKNGIISFVSNGSYVDNVAFSGFRRELVKEFNHIYVFNLRGNQRTQGELSRKEGGKIFGSGSRNTICIILLVKKEDEPFDGFIHYKDIGDYLTREQKLEIISNFGSFKGVDWEIIEPDKNSDWINKKNENYEKFLLIGGKKDKDAASVFGVNYCLGLNSSRDAWLYNFNIDDLISNNYRLIDNYNSEVDRIFKGPAGETSEKRIARLKSERSYDPTKYNWSSKLDTLFFNGTKLDKKYTLRKIMRRPFCMYNMFYHDKLVHRGAGWREAFPEDYGNLSICVSGIGTKKGFSCLMSNVIQDYQLEFNSQCYPLCWFDKDSNEISLFDGDDYSINDDALNRFITAYNNPNITKEDIFYYIYGLFHSKQFVEKYQNDLVKELPRIPFVDGFDKYVLVGKKLADLHVNYEKAPAYSGVKITKKSEDYTVNKMRFLSKDRTDTIIYNDFIKIEKIPEKAFQYVVNGRCPIEWILDQYQYTVDSDSGIVWNPNDYDKNKKGKYVFDLLLSIINVCVKTTEIIEELPEYKEIN